MDNKNKLGSKIKAIREIKKISIEDLADKADLPAESIKKIENGEFIPNLTPLLKLARVMGVRIGTFLDDQEDMGPTVNRKNEKKSVTRFSDKDNPVSSDLDFYSLAANKAGRHMEPFVIDIYPSSEKGYKLSSHEGEEFIYVLQGEIEVIYGKDVYALADGDSIYYDSVVKHHLHSKGTNPAKILAVIYTPV